MECLWYCFRRVLQAECHAVRERWNTHRIRKSRSATVAGRPDSLYLLAELPYWVVHISIYYMEESVLLGTKPLVDCIRHFIRDLSGVFSVCHLCECRIVQWRHDSRAFCFCWIGFSRRVCCLESKPMASRFASISDEEVKEFTEKIKNGNTKKKTLYDIRVWRLWREKGNWRYYASETARKETENHCIWWFKSKSVFFSVFTSNISSQNFASLGVVFLYTWHRVLYNKIGNIQYLVSI